jgi:chromosome segregation ATPase
MNSNLQAVEARITSTQAEFVRVDSELRDSERSLATVNMAIGSVREQLVKAANELTVVERRLDQNAEANRELDELQAAINGWVKEAQAAQQVDHLETDLPKRLEVFLGHLRQYLTALGHSALLASSAGNLQLDEDYIPYMGSRRLRSLGSASDQSRLVAAYTHPSQNWGRAGHPPDVPIGH